MDEQILAWVAQFSYPAVFLLLLGTGFGAPISEELVLLAGGWACAQGASFGGMVLVAWLGTLCADGCLFRIGRRFGPAVFHRGPMARVLTPARRAWVEGHFKRFGAGTILVARFLPGLRAPTFVMAGVCGMSPMRFFVPDALGALVFAPSFIWLGRRLGPTVVGHVRSIGSYLVIGLAVVILVAVVRRGLLRFRHRGAGEAHGESTIDHS